MGSLSMQVRSPLIALDGPLIAFSSKRSSLSSASSVPKAAQEMRRRGHSAAAIDRLVYGNPVKFLSQSPRFKDPAAQA